MNKNAVALLALLLIFTEVLLANNDKCKLLLTPTAAVVQADQDFLTEMAKEPVKTYIGLQKNASANVDFAFRPHRPVVEQIIGDLQLRLMQKFGDKHKVAIERSLENAKALLINGEPLYKKTIEYIFYDYLPTLDLIFGERHPHLMANDFHKRNAERMLKPLIDKAPKMFLYFSFGWVDDSFFIDSRTAPINLIGIHLGGLDDLSAPPYADKFPMKPSEFAWHDLGHAEFTSWRDLEYLENSPDKKPLQRVVWEWESTRLLIKTEIDKIEKSDPLLAAAINQILFELLRERGFQFSLSVLKRELETQKWNIVLLRKLEKGFYDYYQTDKAKFSRLEEARQFLLKIVNQLKERDQLNWLQATRAMGPVQVPVSITHNPALSFATGRFDFIELSAHNPTQVNVITADGKSIRTDIREFISAQVDPTDHSPLDTSTLAKIEFCLSRGHSTVLITKDKQVLVRLNSGNVVSLEQAWQQAQSLPQKYERKLDNIEIFEINQILGAHERGEPQALTLRPPAQKIVGTISLQQNTVYSESTIRNSTATVTASNGDIYIFPLVELRIDPLTDDPAPKPFARFASYLKDIRLFDWHYDLKDEGERLFMQLKFVDFDSYSGKTIEERSGKRYLSNFMTKNEIVQQALALGLSAIEHQLRKNFFYKGQRILGPHFNIDMLKGTVNPAAPTAHAQAGRELKNWLKEINTIYGKPSLKRERNGYSVAIKLNSGKVYRQVVVDDQLGEVQAIEQIFSAFLLAMQANLKANFLVDGLPIYSIEERDLKALQRLCSDENCLDRRNH